MEERPREDTSNRDFTQKNQPVDTLTLDLASRTVGEIYFCCLSPNLCYFVMAAPVNEYTQLLGWIETQVSETKSVGAFSVYL